jgi:uncharacterized protein YndB with AHSA1/START domain
MIEFTNTIDVARDASDVFTYLANLEHIPEWNPAIERSEKLTPGPIGVGTQFREFRSDPVRSIDQLTVAELEPDRRLVVTGRLGPFDARLSYVVLPARSSTRVINTVELDAGVPLGVVGRLAGRRIGAAVAANLRDLKKLLEAIQ